MSEVLNLYLITLIKAAHWDEWDGFVVCAANINEAYDFIHKSNIHKTNSVIKYLGMADESVSAGIVLEDYNAG